jgi:hypothetical protein
MSRARDERAALRAETTQLLQDLGGSAEEVAAHLESAGVKGIPGSGTGCAVARYINAVMASDPRLGPITVSNEAVTILGRHWWTPPVIVPVPLPVRSFIVRFDREDFVSLTAAPGSHRQPLGPGPADHAASRHGQT